jgi:Ca2+-binding RTX toxin-like protein
MAIIRGDDGTNILRGTNSNDTILGFGGNDAITGGGGADTIDGGAGDLDGVSYQDSGAGVTVSLVAGAVGIGGTAQGDRLTNIEGVVGSNFGDVLTGNNLNNVLNGRGGNDVLFGGRGADSLRGDAGADDLYGGIGRDRLHGGSGDDFFIWQAINESGIGPNTADRVEDFNSAAGDMLVFSDIDAIPGGSDQAFQFIGSQAFTAPGQVRAFQDASGLVRVELNTNSFLGADAAVFVSGQDLSGLLNGDAFFF